MSRQCIDCEEYHHSSFFKEDENVCEGCKEEIEFIKSAFAFNPESLLKSALIKLVQHYQRQQV